jgi:cytochrome c oxidase cbb3-type subunit III
MLGLSLLLAACSDSTPRGTTTNGGKIAASQHHERGRTVYNARCYFCHGYSGDAQTLASTYLNPRPRDFAALSADQMSREQMVDAVVNGREGTAMKGFFDVLTRQEIDQAVDFVHQEFVIAKAPNTVGNSADNIWPYRERYSVAFPYINDKVSPLPHSYPPAGIQINDWPEAGLINAMPLPPIPELGKGASRDPK